MVFHSLPLSQICVDRQIEMHTNMHTDTEILGRDILFIAVTTMNW